MTKAKVVFIHGIAPKLAGVIASHTPDNMTTVVVDRDASDDEKVEAVKDADFLVIYTPTFSDRVLQSATKARLIQVLSAGYDRLNLPLMEELGIPFANNGGANSWAVSDHAVLLMLSLYRKLVVSDQATRDGRWLEPIDGTNTFEMAGKLVGILGIGRIGKQVAKRVQGFDAKVQYYDKYSLPTETNAELNVSPVSLDRLFQTSDIITCHTGLTSETRHIVSRDCISMMKAGAVLINTSRGGVVDEPALIEALKGGRIAGAGLDVFEQEPVDPKNPLLSMDNVVVTPHAAGTTWDTWFRRAEFAYENLSRVWRGEEALSVVRESS
jgi:glyoxylate reductase